MVKRLFAGGCAVVVIVVSLRAAPLPPETTARLDALFARWRSGPGVIVAVAKDGETVFSKGYGLVNSEHTAPLTPETVSDAGPVAEQVTAAAVVLLAERGELSLDDPICRYFPELPADVMGEITVRMLLNHTSGLRDVRGLFAMLGRPSYSSWHDNIEALQVLSRQRQLNFAPGTEHRYTSSGYILAALLVHRLGGYTFPAFCNLKLFQPLGLTHTTWRVWHSMAILGRASGHKLAPGMGSFFPHTLETDLVGDAGLLTTVGDLLIWNASLDRTDGEWGRVVRQLQTPSRLKNGREINFGLGLVLRDFAGLREVSRGGPTVGYEGYSLRLPERGFSLALLTNRPHSVLKDYPAKVARVVLDLPSPPPPVAVEVPPSELESLAGLYYTPQLDDMEAIQFREGRLWNRWGALIPLGDGRFVESFFASERLWQFPPGKPGEAILTDNDAQTLYVRRAEVGSVVSKGGDYVGRYRSDELDVTYQVELTGTSLSIRLWPQAKIFMHQRFADGFEARQWWVTFIRDDAGHVVACEFSNPGCLRVRLERTTP